ncbi:MAG: NTP transferase domain-containing protein [Verrucomicrobia bacterium]|nr:NTP transferase domain-containing protein [Verrucomicrobiota bacterium]
MGADKILGSQAHSVSAAGSSRKATLVVLAAGKGTRFGVQPKCIQPVLGKPLARHSIESFGAALTTTNGSAESPSVATTAICVVGYRHEEVAGALGTGNTYVLSDNPTGGTAYAVFEVFSVPDLIETDPLLVITMGDRVVPAATFRRLLETHTSGAREADLTLLTARYEPPRHLGKGRVLRNEAGRVTRIIEEKDIAAEPEAITRQALLNLTEGNCPLYAIRARALHGLLAPLTNENAQGQFYLTDIIEHLAAAGGDIRTITTQPSDAEYDLLCADVTRPADLALLEGVLRRQRATAPAAGEIDAAVQAIVADRPPAQVASIARQLQEILDTAQREKLGCQPDEPIAIGISGGRLRVAFMHPDMSRFFGPAWQMPIGAGSAEAGEQIVVLAQPTNDRRLHLYPLDAKYRESINTVPADDEVMYPGAEIGDWHSYEHFGTRMSENLLLSLGYFTDEEIEARRQKGLPLPPPALRVASNMRRPFALVANTLASLRTLRDGHLGARVQRCLDRSHFTGLRILCTGNIPQGGFSSSSALTVATKNALNALFDLSIPPDVLVHLACQAEYGTGVRAGSLDQATEQKGRAGQGTLISSNPADNYRILDTYPVPADRFKVIFPYSVERDRTAWRWSWGMYGETVATATSPDDAGAQPAVLTAGEWRKLTGKAAEIAAILTRLPLDLDFFKQIEGDLLEDGQLSVENRRWIASVLRQLPLCIRRRELWNRLSAERAWYVAEQQRVHHLDARTAATKADSTLAGLFAGWRDPLFPRPTHTAQGSEAAAISPGVPLRAIVAYLFSEVAKNFHLIHHPEEWIGCVTRSQMGDRSVAIDPGRLPDAAQMVDDLPWENGLKGPEKLSAWLERHGAAGYDFNRDLGDALLEAGDPPEFHCWAGGSFFRGLALIDLAEAMLKRAFGKEAVAVRVNAAGQGDYFQVHIDAERADPGRVKDFLRHAFYRRFGLKADPEFVETTPGGGAVGLRLTRYDAVPELVRRLRTGLAGNTAAAPVHPPG